MADRLDAFSQAMRFICGVSALIVPDNPRALMSKADRYEPVLNASVVVFCPTLRLRLPPCTAL